MYPDAACWYPAHISSQVRINEFRHGSILICQEMRPIPSQVVTGPHNRQRQLFSILTPGFRHALYSAVSHSNCSSEGLVLAFSMTQGLRVSFMLSGLQDSSDFMGRPTLACRICAIRAD